jgi:hypothetical protein
VIPRWQVPVILWAVLACSGGDEPAPAGQPAASAPQAAPSAQADSAAPAADDSTRLQREVFSYRGAGRDPFLSLLRTSSIRPLVQDVRLTGVTYDARYPARSVATIRDTAQNKRYAVRVGDELGLMRVTEIRRDAVVVTLDDFGQERQVVLSVRRREEPTP